MKLEIKTENDVLTGYLIGRLDTVSAEQFGKDMQPLLDNADKKIVVDCADLEYISSSGLRLFLTLRKKVLADKGTMVITNINAEIKSVFDLTGFTKLFDIQ